MAEHAPDKKPWIRLDDPVLDDQMELSREMALELIFAWRPGTLADMNRRVSHSETTAEKRECDQADN